MLNQEMLHHFSHAIGKAEVVSFAGRYTGAVPDLIELSLHPQHEVSFRAAWVLENISASRPEKVSVHMPAFLDAYMVQQNASSMRHFTKIMMSFSGVEHNFQPNETERIIEITFEWMIAAETPVAVRVNCMDILYDFRKSTDWIADELVNQISFFMKDGTAALQSRGKRVLARLARERRKMKKV